jgi:hypothetical protein
LVGKLRVRSKLSRGKLERGVVVVVGGGVVGVERDFGALAGSFGEKEGGLGGGSWDGRRGCGC